MIKVAYLSPNTAILGSQPFIIENCTREYLNKALQQFFPAATSLTYQTTEALPQYTEAYIILTKGMSIARLDILTK